MQLYTQVLHNAAMLQQAASQYCFTQKNAGWTFAQRHFFNSIEYKEKSNGGPLLT